MNKPWFEKTFDGVNDDLFDDDVIKYLDIRLDDGGVGGNVIKDFGFPLNNNNGGYSGGEGWGCNFQHLAGFCGGNFVDDSIVESHTFSGLFLAWSCLVILKIGVDVVHCKNQEHAVKSTVVQLFGPTKQAGRPVLGLPCQPMD